MGPKNEGVGVKTELGGVFWDFSIFGVFIDFLKKCQNRYYEDLKGLITCVILSATRSYMDFWNQRDFSSCLGANLKAYG
jgi:hypothetical protein